MWILESNGDLLQGKRMWLKPGQKYLFGRVKRDGVHFAIDHKTVSRKHFIIELDLPAEKDVTRVHARTKIRIQDQGSKSGTGVNGELVRNQARELKEAENSVRPGGCPQELVIRWQPCVLTFNLLKKEIKAGALKTKQGRVQNLDIKAVSDFFTDSTTHVVANKRNTAKGLLALVTGKHLVSESYVDALQYAATPTNPSQEENLSPLEQDFDGAWPAARDHLPPAGREPTIRPAEAYAPDPARLHVFSGHTFVFGDETQYENLLPVITNGHGKALLFNDPTGDRTAQDLIQFLRSVSDDKDSTDSVTRSRAKVILVRWLGKEGRQDSTNAMINEAALKRDQRAIDQSEFLDAILANDASLLAQPVPFESTSDGRVAPPPSTANSLAVDARSVIPPSPPNPSLRASTERPRPSSRPESAVPPVDGDNAPNPSSGLSQADEAEVVQPARPGPLIRASKFTDFDDGFDENAIIAYDDEDEQHDSDHQPHAPDPTASTEIKQEPNARTQKRPHASDDDEAAFVEEMDQLFPAATAFKRRKGNDANVAGRGTTTGAKASQIGPKTKQDREIDVRGVVRAKREEEEAAARRDEEDLGHAPGYIDDGGPANLVTVVTVDLPVRHNRRDNTRSTGATPAGWDPKWNGRKNFKGFHRRGEPPTRRGLAHKVIVPLVEINQVTYGLGDEYWEKTEEERQHERVRKSKERSRSQRHQTQTPGSSGTLSAGSGPRSVIEIDDDDDGDDFEQAEHDDAPSTSPAVSRLQRGAAEIAEDEIDLNAPRRTRAGDRNRGPRSPVTDDHVSQARSGTPTPTSTARGKRAATSSLAGTQSKRPRVAPATVGRGGINEDDDSDDMKFRFGSKARRGRGRGVGAR